MDPFDHLFQRVGYLVDTVDSAVFQRTVHYTDEYGPGYHVVLDAGKVATVRVGPVASGGS